MASFFFNCIKHFGFFAGLIVYLKIKILKTETIKLPGYKSPIHLRSKSSDITSFREIFFRKEYDIEMPANFIPRVIVDAGANVGYTSIFFAKKYSGAKIFSLEPEEENFKTLKLNVGNYGQITPLQLALWSSKGIIEIMDQGYGNRGFTIADFDVSHSRSSIPCTTVPDLVQDYQLANIDILKMDIEGSEKEVFSSDCDKWLPLTKCLIVELHDRMKAGCSRSVFKAISNYNFEFSLRGENLIFFNKDLI